MLGLSGARPETLVRHLPLIFDSVIQLLVQQPKISAHTMNDIEETAFGALCMILENINVSCQYVFYPGNLSLDFFADTSRSSN